MNLHQRLQRSTAPGARHRRSRRRVATCFLGLLLPLLVAVAPAGAGAATVPGPPYPPGGFPDGGGLDTPTPYAMVDTDAIAPSPGIIQAIGYYDSGQGAAGNITFFSVAPTGPYSGTYTSSLPAKAGSSTPGQSGVATPLYDRQFFVPQGGWVGFSEDAPIVGYGSGGGDHVLFDFSPNPQGFQASAQNNLNFQFNVANYYPATRMYVQESYQSPGRFNAWFATTLPSETGGNNREVPDNTESANINISGSDPNAVLTDCRGNPIASPVLYSGSAYPGIYQFCVQGDAGRELLTVSDADPNSGVATWSHMVGEQAPLASASPSAAGVGTAKATGRALRLPVRCQARAHCLATVHLTTIGATKVKGARGTVTRKTLVAVGSATESLSGRAGRTLTVALNAAGRRALASSRTLRILASIALRVNSHTSRSVQVVNFRR